MRFTRFSSVSSVLLDSLERKRKDAGSKHFTEREKIEVCLDGRFIKDDAPLGIETNTLAKIEREVIFRTLIALGGNRTKAVKRLGISIRTLRNKLNEYARETG